MSHFLTIFSLVTAVLFGLEMLNPVQIAVIEPWTNGLARLSAWLMKIFDADVISNGRVLQSQRSGLGVSIEAGCNGVEAAIILIGGVLAFPAPWWNKMIGIFMGVAAVQAANVLRVISLFYLNMWSKEAFDFAHLYLWQALIMLDVLIVWLLWMRSVARRAGFDLVAA